MKKNANLYVPEPFYNCPLDHKACDYDLSGEEDSANPMRSCRYKLNFNSNISNPPCGRELFRKKKSTKPKSKRKTKGCGCK